MSRDYKPTQAKSGSGKGSPFLSGLLLGLLLGVGISVGVAVAIKGSDSPFVSKVPPVAKHEDAKSDPNAQPKDDNGSKPRFDFYTILPGSESQVTEQEIQEKAKDPEPAKAKENYFLQVGAFQTEQEADNMKAKLALLGMEAVVQTANIPDKGVLHRVRVGPLNDLEQISKSRDELTRNGFHADLIKVNSQQPDQ